MNYVSLDSSGYVLLACYLAISCKSDLTKGIIANRVNYSFLLIALGLGLGESVVQFWFGSGGQSTSSLDAWALGNVLSSSFFRVFLGALICFGLTLVCWRFGNMGGADVKMATVIGAFLGPYLGLIVIAICHMLALATVVFDLVWRYRSAIRLGVVPSRQQLQPDLQRRVPMAGFYAIAVIGVLMMGAFL
jgi:Flp pilus assembly protein protease CpaA